MEGEGSGDWESLSGVQDGTLVWTEPQIKTQCLELWAPCFQISGFAFFSVFVWTTHFGWTSLLRHVLASSSMRQDRRSHLSFSPV